MFTDGLGDVPARQVERGDGGKAHADARLVAGDGGLPDNREMTTGQLVVNEFVGGDLDAGLFQYFQTLEDVAGIQFLEMQPEHRAKGKGDAGRFGFQPQREETAEHRHCPDKNEQDRQQKKAQDDGKENDKRHTQLGLARFSVNRPR